MNFPDHSTCTQTIWDFLGHKKLPWEKNPVMLHVVFRVIGELGIYRVASVGRRHTSMVSLLSQSNPSKYVILDGIGGLMGELMDMSILFNMYKVDTCQKNALLEYTVWIRRLEAGQEHNIDADLIEQFCGKVFEK